MEVGGEAAQAGGENEDPPLPERGGRAAVVAVAATAATGSAPLPWGQSLGH